MPVVYRKGMFSSSEKPDGSGFLLTAGNARGTVILGNRFPKGKNQGLQGRGMGERVTIYDIAKELNLSASTVSRVLGNSTRPVNPEIRRAVEETAKRLHYYPNTIARSLKTDSNRSIGVILPSISNPFYPSIVRGMEDEAAACSYAINICSCDRDGEKMDRYVERAIEERVSGLIAIYIDDLPRSVDNYRARGGKVLVVGPSSRNYGGLPTIRFDKEMESYRATRHLLELGHRKIALFLSHPDTRIRSDKLEGYRKALEEYGIADTQRYVCFHGEGNPVEDHDSVPDCNTGIHCAERLLADHPDVTGIVCMNDLVALGCISVLKRHGISIPEKMSVIGFDDTFFSPLLDPQLTTLRIDKYELGRQAVRMSVALVEGTGMATDVDGSKSVKLVVRESTCKPRSEDAVRP
jgi:DNA-binding LacI/PurR family transcriptional regulator